jgi:hypothetical protein
MNFRHTLALAAVGWYLMTPPIVKCGPHDDCPIGFHYRTIENAPLSSWHNIGSYDTAKGCHDDHIAQMRFYGDKWADKDWMERAMTALLDGQCISTDDPRLKGD